MSRDPDAGGLVINWQMFGSNGQETADYSRGVLERFTRRAPKEWTLPNDTGNAHVKSIANPRKINSTDPHTMIYFEGSYPINEVGKMTLGSSSESVTADKIVVNHYHCKSWEEYSSQRAGRGDVFFNRKTTKYTRNFFDRRDRNDEFDDGILRYRDEQAKTYQQPDKSRAAERLFNALIRNLSPTLLLTTPTEFYAGKMETFLTCRAVSSYLKTKLTGDTANFFEEASLVAIPNSFNDMTLPDARMFLRELPQLLSLPYPVVKDIRNAAIQIIPQVMEILRLNDMWKDYVELDYLKDILKLGG